VSQAGTEAGCVVLFDVTSDGIVYSRPFTNLGGKNILPHSFSSIELHVTYILIHFDNKSTKTAD